MTWKRTDRGHPIRKSHPASAAGDPPPPTMAPRWIPHPGRTRDVESRSARPRDSEGGAPWGVVQRRACRPRPCTFTLALLTSVAGGCIGGQCYMLRDGPRCGGDPVATQPVAGRAGVTLATCLLMVATKRSWVVWAVGASPLRHP